MKPKQAIPGAYKPKNLSNQAKSKAKSHIKRAIKLFVMFAVLAVIGLIVYLVFFNTPKADKVVKKAIDCASVLNSFCFKDLMTPDSVEMLDSAWSDESAPGSWEFMMEELAGKTRKSKVKGVKEIDKNGVIFSEVTVDIDGNERTVFLRRIDENWRITINVPLNPAAITFPDNTPPEVRAELLQNSENDNWWEDADAGEEGKDGEKKKSLSFKPPAKLKKFFR